MDTYGTYLQNGEEYAILERKTPRHWYNYFYNDTYNAFASQVLFGEGLIQDDLGRRVLLVTNRMLYISDRKKGTWFTANGLPMELSYENYRCRHGMGYSVIESEHDGIAMRYTIFVPLEGNCEQWILEITNKRGEQADLRAIAYCATGTDGGYRPQGYNTNIAGFDRKQQAAWTRLYTGLGDGEVRETLGYLITDGEVTGYDCRKNAFIGIYGEESRPEALTEGKGCRNSDCVGEKVCLALEASCALAPGETKTIHFMAGLAKDAEEIYKERERLSSGKPEEALENVRETRLREMDGASIETPDEALNLAFNHFYKYATVMGSRWARVRHNGYRDLMSDAECLSAFAPKLAWERFKRVLGYQYSNGYAPRTFIDGQIRDNNFADCAVWISFTGYALLMELGDVKLLLEEVPFNDGSCASVYEHIRRSVDYLYHFTGRHGLIKLWGGDWNDCMNQAGLKGQGESVWLTIAWYRANKMWGELAKLLGREDDVQKAGEMGAHMEKLVEEYGWDGEYYLTAIDDEGQKIGSHENEEGKMYLNPQLWAVFSGIGTDERRRTAIDSADEYLDTPLGAVVSKPAYTHIDNKIGSMTQKPAGVHENGGVYLHSMAWKLAADCMLKRPEKVQKDIEQILPWNQKWAPTVGEPYILFNSYFGEQTGYRYATPGQSWRTASTAWFVKAMLLYVFGLQPRMEGLRIDPCLPPDWKESSVEKEFRGCVYRIRYHRLGEGVVNRIVADGEELSGNLLPYKKGKTVAVDVYLQ